MKQRGCNGLAAFLTSCLVVGLVTGAAPVSADTDIVTPIDPTTGKVLVAPGDSALAEDVTAGLAGGPEFTRAENNNIAYNTIIIIIRSQSANV
jgi:hypothetical protein